MQKSLDNVIISILQQLTMSSLHHHYNATGDVIITILLTATLNDVIITSSLIYWNTSLCNKVTLK